jgi:hypothetical protein
MINFLNKIWYKIKERVVKFDWKKVDKEWNYFFFEI